MIKNFLLENILIIIISLVVGGLILIIFEKLHKENDEKNTSILEIKDISYGKCLLIGLFQSIAVIPGVSRSAATIIGGLALGLKRKTIVEFSFLLAVPTILAALLWDLIKNAEKISSSEYSLFSFGFLSAFIVGGLSIKFFLNYIKKYNFIPFGFYRIIIGLLFLLFWI